MKRRFCSPDIELLHLQCRPFYLPREFSCVHLLAAYLPPDGSRNSCAILDNLVNTILSTQSDSLLIIAGDFNRVSLSPDTALHQHVTVATRENNTLDLVYSNVADAYRSVSLPPLANSDHNAIHMIPQYVTRHRRQPPKTVSKKAWDDETAVDELRCSLETTDWDVFINVDIDETVQAITGYITHLETTIIYERQVRISANSKPWITEDIRSLIRAKHQARKARQKTTLSKLQKELNRAIFTAKQQYRNDSINKMLENPRAAWQGLKQMTGSSKPTAETISAGPVADSQLAHDLNTFYARFEDASRGPVCRGHNSHDTASRTDDDLFTQEEVLRVLSLCSLGKAPGPDDITNRLLRTFANELTPIVHKLFNWCASTGKVPTLWKLANIKPVPKKPIPKESNDFRPIALTSCLMKCFEKLVKAKLEFQIHSSTDPLQFAYKANRSTNDACTLMQQCIIDHIEGKATYARVLFLDYSSAFNTIVPSILINRLKEIDVSDQLIAIISCFLSNREQFVTVHNETSATNTTNTGAPQGCVLSPLLFTIYTDALVSHYPEVKIIKYADDTAIIGLVTAEDESHYRAEVERVVKWCDSHNLLLNKAKTKEMVINFTKVRPPDLCIDNNVIERVNSFRYLGVVFDETMTFKCHTDHVIKKANARLYMMRRYASFGATKDQLHFLFTTMILSIITYNCHIFYHACTNRDKLRLARVIRKCRVECNLDDVMRLQTVAYARSIIKSTSHPLSGCFTLGRSGRRFLLPRCRTERKRGSFICKAINFLNG